MKAQHGFSLVELAMVLFIVSLLLGGLLVPLATQLEGRQRSETREQLDEIVQALLGFAIINGRFPCYTTATDPTNSATYGLEDAVCNPAGLTTDGYLPWRTLGLGTQYDAWGVARTSATDPFVGFWRYRVDTNFLVTFNLNTGTANSLVVQELDVASSVAGTPAYTTITSPTENPIAIIYSTGANQTADGQNATYNTTYEGGVVSNLDRDGDGDADEFDDITVWITRPLLFSRMVSAGRLP